MIRGTETDVVVVMTTLPDDNTFESFGRTLVNEQLAACVVVSAPSHSVYTWQSKVETTTERQVTIKTRASRVAELKKRLVDLHPYDVPEFLVLQVSCASQAYVDWVRASTTPPQK